MKKLIVLLIIITPFILASISHSSGSHGGFSSSSGDGGSCTVCHAGSNNIVTGWITSNIPSTGYITGQTYTITITGTHLGVKKLGFEITSEDASWNKKGQFIITNTSETKLTNSDYAVTHTGNGIIPIGNSKSWSFNWKAPTVGTGTITFSAALLAANGNMGTSGDTTYITNIQVNEAINNSFKESTDASIINLRKSVSTDEIIIDWGNLPITNLIIYNINGIVVYKKLHNFKMQKTKIDISNFAKGMYIIKLRTESKAFTKKFIKA